MPSIWICAIAALFVARAVEWVARARPLTGTLTGELLRSAAHAAAFAFLFLVTARPITALATFVTFLVALEIVDRAKTTILSEGLVFSDLALVGQILRNPQIYYISPREYPLPGLGILIGFVLLGLAVIVEDPVQRVYTLWVAGVAAFAFLGASLCSAPLVGSPALLEPPCWGKKRFGLVTALFLQWAAWRRQETALPRQLGDPRPSDCDLILVQIESFADLPAHGYPLAPLAQWDGLKPKALQHGPLGVEAAGANTVRTEFSVLSGLAGASLGFDMFNPYLRPQRYAANAWPERLARAGWSTTCIHPNDASFFGRHKAIPALGFRMFRTDEAFANAPRCGPHVSDEAVVDAILDRLDEENVPQFIFAITMENHGPWNPPRLAGIRDPLNAYFTHLHNAETAITRLVAALMQRERRSIIIVYGDHLPALEPVREALQGIDTSYLIIDTATATKGKEAAERVLPHQLIEIALRELKSSDDVREAAPHGAATGNKFSRRGRIGP